MIPAGHALWAALALKLWSIERKSHLMALVADEGLGLFCGLNVIPKKSYLSEYSARIKHTTIMQLLAAWHRQVAKEGLFAGESFNLDFPLRALLRRGPTGAAALRVGAEPPAAECARLSRAGHRGADILLLQRRSSQGRGA